jgi:heat shock protein HslJ
MKKILWMVALVATTLVACNKNTNNAQNVSGEWNLIEMNGQSMAEAETATLPFIGFNQAESSIYGNAGCNSFFGTMVTDENNANALRFDNMGSTKMMCPNMEVEDAMLSALAKVSSIEFNEEELQLKDANNQTILRFSKKN